MEFVFNILMAVGSTFTGTGFLWVLENCLLCVFKKNKKDINSYFKITISILLGFAMIITSVNFLNKKDASNNASTNKIIPYIINANKNIIDYMIERDKYTILNEAYFEKMNKQIRELEKSRDIN